MLKLLLVPAMVGLVSLLSQRFGQGVAGLLSGLPVIAATVTAVLMLEAPRESVAAIAHASYAAIPAAFAYTLAFSWVARWIEPRHPGPQAAWLLCLGGAALAFFVVGFGLQALPIGHAPRLLIALASPLLTLALMPRQPGQAPIAFRIPRVELGLRMAFAFLMAMVLMWSATRLSPAASGLVLAWPITGCVLPCFTIALYGSPATLQLLKGFANGLFGFTCFFAALASLLDAGLAAGPAFVLSLLAALAGAWVLLQLRRQRAAG